MNEIIPALKGLSDAGLKQPRYFSHSVKRITANEVILLYGAAFAFLVLSLFPFLQLQFVHHDDWNLFNPDFRGYGEFDQSLSIGRPVNALLMFLMVFPFVHRIPDLLFGRLLEIGVLTATLSYLVTFLRRYQFSWVVAFCAGALVVSLPGVQQHLTKVSSLPLDIANLLGLVSGGVIVESGLGFKPWHDLSLRERRVIYLNLVGLGAAFFTYQGSAMFFLLPVLCDALFAHSESLPTRIFRVTIRTSGLFSFLGVCFVIYKLIILPVIGLFRPAVLIAPLPFYHLGFSANITERIRSAVTNWIPIEASLWFLGSSFASLIITRTIVIGTLAILLFYAIANYTRSPEQTKQSILSPIWALACTYILVLAANSPSFVSDAGGVFARVMLPASALIAILLFWIITEICAASPRFLNVVLIALTVLAVAAAHFRAFYTAMNSYTEFEIMRDAVGKQAKIKGPIKQLLVMRPPDGHSYLGPPPYHDEFDFISTTELVNTIFMYHEAQLLEPRSPAVADLEQQGELLWDPAYNSGSCGKDVFYLSQEAVVADMAAPMYLAENPGSCVGAIARYFVTPVSDPAHNPTRALESNGRPDDFWEATPYPITLNIFYPSAERVTAYSLGTNAHSDSMVTAWRLEASKDNVTWVTLDQQSGISTWPPNGDSRTFPIANSGSYQAYRFVFIHGSDWKMRIYHIAIKLARPGDSHGQAPHSR